VDQLILIAIGGERDALLRSLDGLAQLALR
jgi:hypothetical protein